MKMYRGNDILKTYDKDFNYIGRATREKVHTEGLLHQVAHMWMFHKCEDGLEIFFQQRAADRELYPGKYDVINTTHFDPEECYEEGIIHSMDYYLGSKITRENIIHIGSTRQIIKKDNYYDNALVQVFVLAVNKVMFYMPETEEIIKVKYEDFADFVHGRKDSLAIYSLDGKERQTTTPEDWWLRKDEFLDVVEPYVESKHDA